MSFYFPDSPIFTSFNFDVKQDTATNDTSAIPDDTSAIVPNCVTPDNNTDTSFLNLYILSLLSDMWSNVCSCNNNIKKSTCIFCDDDITPFGCSCPYKTHDVCCFCDSNRIYLFDALKMGINDNFTAVRTNRTADEVRYILYTYLEVIKSQVVGDFIYYNDIRNIMDKYILQIC